MNAVWIVDDDQSIRWVLERALSREGFDVRAFGTARDCLSALDLDSPRVLVSDIRMPGESGIELLQQVKQRRPGMPVIIMTAFSDLDSAVSAFQGGAFEYLPKPFDLKELIAVVQRALTQPQAGAVAVQAEEEGQEKLPLIGRSPAMQEIYRVLARLMGTDLTVMITGESGTGKELVARALHDYGKRRSG
ncbi:MAG: response regulator, partial [Gemmatimonas sp.]